VTGRRQDAFEQLRTSDGRANKALLHALTHHPIADIREDIAEILGDRKNPKSIPALIEALTDECLFVRQDALWSIERICEMQPCALSFWLDLDHTMPAEVHRKVRRWWRLNKRYLEGNAALLSGAK
jgi:HEAT repeat protein